MMYLDDIEVCDTTVDVVVWITGSGLTFCIVIA